MPTFVHFWNGLWPMHADFPLRSDFGLANIPPRNMQRADMNHLCIGCTRGLLVISDA